MLYKSAQFPGVIVNLLGIENTNPGNRPKVTFSLGSKYAPLNPDALNRLRLSLSGPNEDFDFYVAETVGGNAIADGENWTYTFQTSIPSIFSMISVGT